MRPLLAIALACTPEEETPPTSDTDTVPEDPQPFTHRQLKAIRDAVDEDLALNGAFAAQVAVWYDGRLVWTEAFGNKDEAGLEPVDIDTLFQIGSDTKKLTAIALLQQVDAGALSLDDTVADAIMDFSYAADPGWAAEATLRDLLAHQGGQYDYTPWDNAPSDSELSDRAYGELAAESFILAPPGAFWNYSNPNFSLAGLAVERADGRPYADILEQDIFLPLGMTRSFARQSEALADGNVGESTGILDYVGTPADLFAPASYELGTTGADGVTDNGFVRPAGLVWSTAADQARLLGFLMAGDPDVLSDGGRAALVTTDVELYPGVLPQFRYGFGLFVNDEFSLLDGIRREPLWSHGGNTLTYTSESFALPERGLAFSILTNVYGASFAQTRAALFDLVDLGPPESSSITGVDVERDHALYVGTYVDPQFGTLIVADEGGELTLAFPDLEAIGWDTHAELTPALTDVYVFTTAELGLQELTFIEDESGTVRWARNRLLVGTRVDEARRAPGSIDAQRLANAIRAAGIETLRGSAAVRGR